MQGFQKAAFRADKLCSSTMLSPLYKASMFRTDTVTLQENSLFMALPTELRLIIYKFIFTPPYITAANILSILAVCRKVHGEAVILALRTTQFHLNGHKGLKFQSKLQGLGDLQQHLRRIDVEMPMQKLDASSGNNPFVLTKLPLASLEIDFKKIENVNIWIAENRIYHRFVSALLHTTTPAHVTSSPSPMHSSFVEKNKRRMDAAFLKPWATKKQLYHMLVSMRAKKLVVKCADDGKDILWSAFTHFSLVGDALTIVRIGGESGTKHRIMFYDEPEENFLEMGIQP